MIKFSEYFHSWLYDKDGYYGSYKTIGKEGDFYTSVSTSSFFGGAIALDIIKAIKEGRLDKNCSIIEIGAHHGYLLADIIQFIYTLEAKLLDTLNFVIVERFDTLQEQQKKYIEESFNKTIKLSFCKDIKELNLPSAYILANEIFDAFACELVFTKDKILQQAFVKDHKIHFITCKNKALIEHCKKYNITKGEVCLTSEDFITTLNQNIKHYEFLTFDYGDKQVRNDFSSRIYKKHEVHPLFEENINLNNFYKKSDLTYDVHFNHLINLFSKNSSCKTEFKTQMKALIDFGILDLLEMLKEHTNHDVYLREVQKVKTLIEPTGMGDRFKMLKVSKYS